MEHEEFLTEKEVAKELKVTPACLQKMRHDERGPRFVRFGRLIRYRRSDVIRYMESN